MGDQDFERKLSKLAEEIKQLSGRREQLAGDVRAEQVQAENATRLLEDLGIANASALSISDLEALKEKTLAELTANIASVEAQLKTVFSLLAQKDTRKAA